VFIFQTVNQKKVRQSREREKTFKYELNALFNNKDNFQNTRNVSCFCTLDSFHSSLYSWINLLKV